ncbi:undecaprenyl-diphosphate phosphatase [Caminibacter mediatlanticus]|uniref:Undecaprenyl-diphosphatase n=1 Tax=Caminibacter mediatlanticus TB-2 TaxID=391592 RepID=A0AAI9AGW4_9BACT|nr:undecaprenyl-diphosphate phosphatase [Caminibacter mediatlanticus]EDM23413.1 Undecaprenol kinase [Caminibacter mediatlanticus TB-2]
MTIIDSIILGIVEGITEFLPISSTAHMIIVSTLLGLKQTMQNVAFEVIIQLGATLAIVFIYLDKINFKEIDLWKKVILAFLPLAIVGFLFRHQIKEFFTITTVAWMFIIGGIIFFIVEKMYKEENRINEVEKVSLKQAFIIGIFQVFALIPGTSRSGATIVGGMLSGLNRKTAADFSFLLALPTMFAASGYEMVKNLDTFKDSNLIVLAVGFIVSFISCYIAVKWFLNFVKKYTLIPFGIYRIIFGIILLYLVNQGIINA